MTANPFTDELRQLRADFEAQASRYHDLSLKIYYLEADNNPAALKLPRPHHAINLWQFVGTTPAALDAFKEITRFGLAKAELTALAVIAGPETALFRRMAFRAATIIPAELQEFVERMILENLLAAVRAASDEESTGKPVISANSNPLAVWINLMIMSISTFQPERLRHDGLQVDPFTGSLAALDLLLGRFSARSRKADSRVKDPFANRRFQVALSFPGEKRDFVKSVADGLRSRGVDVFYDHFFEAELATLDLDIRLQRIYHENSDLLVVFVCEEYERKDWCGLEFRAIRDLIKRRRADLMLMRFDDTELPGVFSIDGYIDLRGRTPEQAIDLICRRITQ